MSEENYQEKFNRKELLLDEKEVIEILVNWKDKKGNYDFRHLTHLIAPDLELQEFFEIKGLYVGTNILRQEFGFDKNEKPGDFDIIVIPYSENEILFERTGVIEVKIVRPSRKKPLRNANSIGTTQVKGLINDGFPFVGLMHISLSEPLKEEEKTIINYCTIPANSGQTFEKGKTFEDYLIPVKMDAFQWFSADKQMQRLITTDLPKYVALLCFGLTQKTNDEFWLETVSAKYSDFQTGYFNPNLKSETIQKVKDHFLKNELKYSKKEIR